MIQTFGYFIYGVIGLGSTFACWGLLHVGQQAGWTSDGPGLLLVMFGAVVTALVALAFWAAVLVSLVCWVFPGLKPWIDAILSDWSE